MNDNELLAAGYKLFEDCNAPDYCKPQYAYQKKIYDDNILLYFINVYKYDWSMFNLRDDYDRITYDCKLCVYHDHLEDDGCLRIEFSCTNMTIDELENFVYNKIYNAMECIPDQLND